MLLTVDTIYGVAQVNELDKASLVISSGAVDIYVSNKAIRPELTTDTSWVLDVSSASGTYYVEGFPKYLYVSTVAGTPVVNENNLLGGIA